MALIGHQMAEQNLWLCYKGIRTPVMWDVTRAAPKRRVEDLLPPPGQQEKQLARPSADLPCRQPGASARRQSKSAEQRCKARGGTPEPMGRMGAHRASCKQIDEVWQSRNSRLKRFETHSEMSSSVPAAPNPGLGIQMASNKCLYLIIL